MKTTKHTPHPGTPMPIVPVLQNWGVDPTQLMRFLFTANAMQSETLDLVVPVMPPEDYIELKNQLSNLKTFLIELGSEVLK